MHDFVVRPRGLHGDKADKAGLWRRGLGRLVHEVVTEYYLPLPVNPVFYVVRLPSSKVGHLASQQSDPDAVHDPLRNYASKYDDE